MPKPGSDRRRQGAARKPAPRREVTTGNPPAYLLDTHVWIWLLEGKQDIANAPLLPLLEAAAADSRLLLASISLWEVAMLESKRRLGFRIPCFQWLVNALKMPGLRVVPINAAIAADSARLPGRFDGDPADRLIIADARHTQTVLVTRDRAIHEYAAEGHLRVVEI